MEEKKQSIFRTVFGMMINPAGTLKKALKDTKWYYCILISALSFGLFFLQTGLDLLKTGQKSVGFAAFSCVSGLIYGAVIIPLLGAGAWLMMKVSKSDKTVIDTISGFCLSYCGALIYGVSGILFSLILGWKTSVAFGVSGVLWAIGPMMITIREMTDGKNKLSVVIATVVGALVLVSWATFGNI